MSTMASTADLQVHMMLAVWTAIITAAQQGNEVVQQTLLSSMLHMQPEDVVLAAALPSSVVAISTLVRARPPARMAPAATMPSAPGSSWLATLSAERLVVEMSPALRHLRHTAASQL